MTWELTPWGVVCQAIADRFVEAYPQFAIGIGPDPDDLNDMSYRVTFIVLDGSLRAPRYSGSDATHPTFDEVLPIRIRIHVPTDLDVATNKDRGPVLAEAAWDRILFEIDSYRTEIEANDYAPVMVPKNVARRGGRIGDAGTTIIALCELSLEHTRPSAFMATATSTTMGLSVVGPDGNGGFAGESIEVIGAP